MVDCDIPDISEDPRDLNVVGTVPSIEHDHLQQLQFLLDNDGRLIRQILQEPFYLFVDIVRVFSITQSFDDLDLTHILNRLLHQVLDDSLEHSVEVIVELVDKETVEDLGRYLGVDFEALG